MSRIEILGRCDICGKEVRSDDPYSLKKIHGRVNVWHALCYLKAPRTVVAMQVSSVYELRNYLLRVFPKPTGWVLDVLRGLGENKC